MAETTVLALTGEAKQTIWIRWFLGLGQLRKTADIQVIPGNDQNTSPTNQKTAESNLERTS